ncbi:hypothetical protein [Streptomyces antimycoticus]|uniref:hypothetical protein n=1 Tax=Streptomyces antimycoticus TaxID=68175 RepID=UPI0033F9105E
MTTNDQPDDKPGEPSDALAEHNRRAAARQGLTPTPAAQRLTEQMLTIFNEFERDRRAEIIAAGGDPDEDRDPLEYVRWIADNYVERRDDPRRLEHALRGLANELTLDDARALRLAGEAVAKALPQLVRLAHDEDRKDAPQIAAELDLTPSRIYDLLRRYVRYTWRADTEQPDGTWHLLDTGEATAERRELTEANLARAAVEQVAPKADGRPVRVLVWNGPQGTEDTALYTHTERP